jgi:tetratricopeptide (TPR) repeat protein/predicted Ser/Thr protein kinase
MDGRRWEAVVKIYHEASEHEPAARAAFLAEACQRDEELRREVESLLEQDVSRLGLLESMVLWNSTPPSSIGSYRILGLIGEGGMGSVYEAEQENPRRRVALKVVKPGLAVPEVLRRFKQESQTLARLQHPGIAQIYEAGLARGKPYFAMERIHGKPLLDYAGGKDLPTPKRLELMVRICEAAHHAHERGIIHRDLKPGNILVDEMGQPKILDFGIARVTDTDAEVTRRTDLGKLVGTLAYMSPEQVTGDSTDLDARSDIYALGLILYELLAGHAPYETGRNLPEAVRIICEQDPLPIGSVNRAFRGDLETIAAKALEKDKSRRYESAADLASDLRRHLADQPIQARRADTLYLARKFVRRHRALVSATAAVFLVLAGGVAMSTVQALRANRERDRAITAERTASAVNGFLQNDLLAQAGATAQAGSGARPDPDMKIRTALDRAAARLAGKFDAQPLVEAAIRRTIGNTYDDLGFFAEARQHLERAVDLRTRVLGPEHADTLTSRHELGHLYRDLGNYRAAESVLTSVVEARRRNLGGSHKDTIAAMNDLAIAYQYDGDVARGAKIHAEILEVDRRLYGEAHPDTLEAMQNLGVAALRLGKYPEAEQLLERALDLTPRVLGPDHPEVSNATNNLAAAFRKEGKYAQADALYAAALEARRRTFGEEHWKTLNTRFGLGLSYRGQGRYAEAESQFRQAAEMLGKSFGNDHPLTLQIVFALGELYLQERRLVEAESLFQKTLEARRRVLGRENPYTAEVLASYGELKLEQHAYAGAEVLLREALQIRDQKTPNVWERFYAQSMLGASLWGLGRYSEARPLLTSGYNGMLERQSSIPAEYRTTLEHARVWILPQ